MQNPFFNSEENRLRSLFRVLLFIFLFVFMMVIPSLIPNTALDYITRSVLTLGLFYITFRYVDGRPWSFSGLKLDKTWIKECIAGIVMAALAMALIFITLWQTGGLEITSFSWNRSGETFWLIPLLIFFVQMASVGFYEEVMARGYLLPNITEGFTLGNITPQKAAIIAVVISSGIFGLGHAGNPNANLTAVVNIVLAGVMLAVPFIITGRLGLSVGIHFSWNFFQGGIFGFRVSGMEVRNSLIQIQQGGPDWWTGGSFGPEAGLIGVLGILLILGLTLLYLKQTGVKLAYADLFSKTFTEQKRMVEESS
ncbi:CPBP family intramembrane glutamic endopeptidase [Gracilimonas sp.]|uniref:CPBP family intramembrane glutamic endopeptidase n=1 Tax=Gracilimonas sp. TaxID=1974203 RepID=UPI003BA903E5